MPKCVLPPEIAKKQRRAATAEMTKCPCGNVARRGQALCSACETPEVPWEREHLDLLLADVSCSDGMRRFLEKLLEYIDAR